MNPFARATGPSMTRRLIFSITAMMALLWLLAVGLGLAVTIALSILGFAFRVRMSHEVLNREIFRLDCARRAAAELARAKGSHPYRAAPAGPPRCMICLGAKRA